jgi:hypothetical protein
MVVAVIMVVVVMVVVVVVVVAVGGGGGEKRPLSNSSSLSSTEGSLLSRPQGCASMVAVVSGDTACSYLQSMRKHQCPPNYAQSIDM